MIFTTAGEDGFEPPTYGFRVRRSAAELLANGSPMTTNDLLYRSWVGIRELLCLV